MVIDCLKAANEELDFKEDVFDVDKYLLLNDTILQVPCSFIALQGLHFCLQALKNPCQLPRATMLGKWVKLLAGVMHPQPCLNNGAVALMHCCRISFSSACMRVQLLPAFAVDN